MVSAMYLLIFLQDGSLPWSDAQNQQDAFTKVRLHKKAFHNALRTKNICNITPPITQTLFRPLSRYTILSRHSLGTFNT